MSVACSICHKMKSRSDFSKTQLRKGQTKKCKQCASNNHQKRIDSNTKSSPYQKCSNYPNKSDKSDKSELFKLNEHQFIVFSTDKTKCYVYNTINNKWRILFQITKQNLDYFHTVTVDYDNHEIYIFVTTKTNKGKILKFNYYKPSETMKTFKLNNHFDRNEVISSIFVNGQYYLMRTSDVAIHGKGYTNCCKTTYHYIWNKQHNKLDKIHKFGKDSYWFSCDKSKDSLLYLKSKNILLLLSRSADNAWCYSLKEKNWTEWKLKNSGICSISCYVLTEDERLIIINSWNEIFIFDITRKEYIKSTLKGPKKYGSYTAVIMNEKVRIKSLLFAYYMSCWNKTHITNIPVLPVGIDQMILNMYGVDAFVHLLMDGMDVSHYKITVKQILKSANL